MAELPYRKESNMKLKQWYGVRSLVFDPDNEFYEERTVIVLANSKDGALTKVAKHTNEYCKSVGLEDCLYSEVFKLVDKDIGDLTEVYSCMRYSDFTPKQYVNKFLATGDEVNLE